MASTYSTSLRLELMATGDQSGTWGDTTNTNLGTLLEQAITGYLSKGMADANQTLTALNGASDESRNMVLDLTGALTAARNVIVPTAKKLYLFKNSTTGGFAVTIKTSAGTGVAIPAGSARWVYCDGTNVVAGLTNNVVDGGTGASTVITAHDALTTKGTDIASAGTINLTTATGAFVDITGTTTIATVTLAEGMQRMVRAAGNFQLAVGASLIGNGAGASIAVKTGDLIFFEGYAAGVVRFWVTRGNGGNVVVQDAPRNYVVNGDKTVSQENLQTAGTGNGRYISDQNAMYFVSSVGVFTGVNVLTLSPAGGYRDRITITTADASLAAGEFLTYAQNLEGSNVRNLKWGTADAVDGVARFGFRGPAGTYAYRLGNSAANRSFVALFTITAPLANLDVTIGGVGNDPNPLPAIAIPSDTSGTWLNTDGVIGITRNIVLAAGSTFQGTTGWQAGNILGTSGVSNGMGTGAAVFEFFDEGLRADPDATGVYGAYEVGEADYTYNPIRYYEAIAVPSNGLYVTAQATSTTSAAWALVFNKKCKAATSVVVPVTLDLLSTAGSVADVTSHVVSVLGATSARVTSTTSSGLGFGGQASCLFSNSVISTITVNARL